MASYNSISGFSVNAGITLTGAAEKSNGAYGDLKNKDKNNENEPEIIQALPRPTKVLLVVRVIRQRILRNFLFK